MLNNQKPQQICVLDQVKQQLIGFQNSIIINVNNLLLAVQSLVQTQDQQSQGQLNYINQILNVQKQLIVQNSEIINSIQIYDNIINFFNRKVSKLSLIFKASDHKFNIKKYFQICGKQTNTMIVCLTRKRNIIGGFTPLAFFHGLYQKNSRFIADPSNSSFVFSLKTNQKFPIKNNNRAILLSREQNFIFFGSFFGISDKAKTKKSVWLDFDDLSYDSLNYVRDKQSNLKVLENQSYDFTVLQWEVMKVEF